MFNDKILGLFNKWLFWCFLFLFFDKDFEIIFMVGGVKSVIDL